PRRLRSPTRQLGGRAQLRGVELPPARRLRGAMMRRFVTLSLLGVAGALLPGHSPYRQWYAYRATHLVVVTDEIRPGALTVAAAVASAIAARWPETKAVPAAARSPVEVVKLLTSGRRSASRRAARPLRRGHAPHTPRHPRTRPPASARGPPRRTRRPLRKGKGRREPRRPPNQLPHKRRPKEPGERTNHHNYRASR